MTPDEFAQRLLLSFPKGIGILIEPTPQMKTYDFILIQNGTRLGKVNVPAEQLVSITPSVIHMTLEVFKQYKRNADSKEVLV